MQFKTILTRYLTVIRYSIFLLGSLFLCQSAVFAQPADSINSAKILKSPAPESNVELISFLQKADDSEKFLFFREAFEKQKIHLFKNPKQYFDEDFPLIDYVQAWFLLSQARQQPKDLNTQKEIQNFLIKHKNNYIAERLRTDWLLVMASYWNEHNQWKTFNSVRKQLLWNKSDPNIVCWDLYHTISSRKTISKNLANEALSIINAPQYKGNNICRKVSSALIKKVPSTAFTRLVILIQQGRISEARSVLNILIQKKRLPARASRLAFNSPAKWYRTYRNKLATQNKHVRLIAAYRLTSVDIDQSVRVANSLNGKLYKAEKSALWGRLGYVGAINHNPNALQWYAKGGQSVCSGPYSALPSDCIQWQARAALRIRDWKKLNHFIANMPANMAKQENWAYWRGRALVEIGHPEQAPQYWQSISTKRTFYGKLASEALGQSFYYSGNETVEATPEAIDSMGKNPSLQRAKYFYDIGLFVEGNREWQWGIRTMNAPELLAAAQWAEKHSLLHRAINTAIKVAEHYPLEHELLYPRPFEDEIEEFAEKAEIDDNWVYGLMRQESRFIAAAKSNVGANGLMQIMPATAKWIAKQLEIEDFKPEKIYEIETNIYFGTSYLRSLLNRLDNKLILATAGYNAGPNRASRWQQSLPQVSEGAIFIETIPFAETRHYVQNVLANTVEYAYEQDQKITSFRRWLGEIDPKADTTTEEKI